jgi:hypothetical protein
MILYRPPRTLRVKGPENWVWGTESQLIELVKSKNADGLDRVQLSDDPSSIVLIAA